MNDVYGFDQRYQDEAMAVVEAPLDVVMKIDAMLKGLSESLMKTELDSNDVKNGNGVEKDEFETFICCQKSAEMSGTDETAVVEHCDRDGVEAKTNDQAYLEYQKSADMN